MNTYTLPPLPYAYDALEPYIDARTMEIHHLKHHQAYVDKLNAAVETYPELFQKDLSSILANIDALPQDIQTVVQNNGGGHLNHSFFWELMSPQPQKEPKGILREHIQKQFESVESCMKKFEETALARFGSGWAWISSDETGMLHIHSTQNQDSPFMGKKIPLIGIDVWEHAYYLKYQNKRAEYVQAWWHVLNWEKADKKYEELTKSV